MFYGRQDDLRWIDERLTQPGNEMILLYGQRRIGKTSLLHQIRNQRESGSILPVFVDTHGLLPMLLDDDSFLRRSGAHDFTRALRWRPANVPAMARRRSACWR